MKNTNLESTLTQHHSSVEKGVIGLIDRGMEGQGVILGDKIIKKI